MNSKDYGLELKYASGAQLVSDGTQIEGYASLFGLTDQGGDIVRKGAYAASLKRLERIEALIEGLERRLWMTVYGVVAVILTQAVQGILEFAPKGG